MKPERGDGEGTRSMMEEISGMSLAAGKKYFCQSFQRLPCDGHHEMSDLGAAGEPVHRSGDSVASVWPHQRWTLARDGWRRR